MKSVIIAAILSILAYYSYSYIKGEEAKKLALIQEIVGSKDARVVWEDSTAEGYSKNFTYWNNDHCMAIVTIRHDESYYVDRTHCSDIKLTK